MVDWQLLFTIQLLEGFGFFLSLRFDGKQGAREHKDLKFSSLSIWGMYMFDTD